MFNLKKVAMHTKKTFKKNINQGLTKEELFQVEILIECRDQEYLSCVQNNMTFGNMSQKLWPQSYGFLFCKWAIQVDEKITFFKSKNFKLVF